MSEYTLPEALAYDESVLGRIASCTSTLGADESTRRPTTGGWSIAEHLEHVAVTSATILSLIRKLVEKLEANPSLGAATDLSFQPIANLLLRASKEKYQAAPAALPKGELSVAESLARLTATHRQLAELAPRIAAVPLHGISFPHRVFGPLTLGQWVAFMGIHEERHLRHIERIL